MVVTGQEGGAVYQSLSDVRCGCCVLVQLFRMTVCVWLAVYGSLFLIHYSITLGDLLLNAVALEFVMTVDETVFEVLAPAAVRRLFPHHFGLRRKPEAAWLGVDPRSLILLTSVAVTLALFVALELLPLMQVEGLGVRGCPPVSGFRV